MGDAIGGSGRPVSELSPTCVTVWSLSWERLWEERGGREDRGKSGTQDMVQAHTLAVIGAGMIGSSAARWAAAELGIWQWDETFETGNGMILLNLAMEWYFGNFNPETLCGWDPVMDDLSSFLLLTFSSIGLFIGPKQICFCNTIVFLISLHCISHWHCPIKSSHWIPLTACQRFQTGSNFNRGQRRARWCWWDFCDYSQSLV